MPASFADDGAIGGGNFGDASIGPTSTLASPSGAPSASETQFGITGGDPGSESTGAGASSVVAGGWGGGGLTPSSTGGDIGEPGIVGGGWGGGGAAPAKSNPLAGAGATTLGGMNPMNSLPGWSDQFTQQTGGPQRVMAYSDGGAIDDGSGSSDPQGDRLTQQINKALGTVDSVLDYGRNLHGLGGGDNTQSGGIQEANAGYSNGRMPAIPGSQSNSGAPPIQPQPGPLPPTSNPFGKRADASDSTDQDGSGGVDTSDEESA